MAEFQIKYVTKSGPSHGAIAEVGGDGWKSSKADVIGLLKSRTNVYFTRFGNTRAEVRVVNGPFGEYLQSAQNGIPNDNLLNLPGFPATDVPAGGLTEEILAAIRVEIDTAIASKVTPELTQLIDARLAGIEAKFLAVGTRIGATEKSVSLQGSRVGNVEKALRTLGVRVEGAEEAIGSAGTKVAKGEVVVPETSALANGSGDRAWTAHVTLPEGMFDAPPQIATSLSRVEFEASKNTRIQLETTNITASSFDLRCKTWLDTRIPTCAVQWIAFGS